MNIEDAAVSREKTPCMAVLQKHKEEYKEQSFVVLLLCLDSRSEQFCDKRRLSPGVSFVSSLNLPLPDHIHHFISSQCSPSRLERKEAHAWFDQSFEKAMILFHQIVEIFALSKFTRYSKNLCCLQFRLCCKKKADLPK